MITFEDIKKDKAIKVYIERADEALEKIGYTEHSYAHVYKVAKTAMDILRALDYPEREIELAGIAGYTHDIGNIVNRVAHSQSGALMMFRLLDHKDMPAEDIATVVAAIGNHDEGTGVAVNAVAAALILADKSDVRRSRVRNIDVSTFDIHDRVNYATVESRLGIDKEAREITLFLTIDKSISSVMDYFEIFLGRMIMCRKAAEYFGLDFKLNINGQQML
jgi:metal-dependent HD superfamily phosphatase/phosphodiesterase